MELRGRVALITGSTGGGMGRSTAFTLAKNGADIVLNYGTNLRDAQADIGAKKVEKAIRDLGRRVIDQFRVERFDYRYFVIHAFQMWQ